MDLGLTGGRGHVALLVRFAVFAIFFFPSAMVIDVIGASGTVPILAALVLLLFWTASWMWGLHDPVPYRHPGRLAICLMMLTAFASYIALYAGLTGGSTTTTRASADRFLLLMFAMLALILVIGESVRTLEDAMQLVRVLLAAAFFCCLVAVVQFTVRINPMEWIGSAMPGFVYNGGDTPFQERGSFTRVAGSTFHSIELAVVSAMLLPLSIWRLVFDPTGRRWFHALQTSLLGFAIAGTVSRSGMLGVTVGMLVFTRFLPRSARRTVLFVAPVAVILVFLTVPGFVGTLLGALGADASDPSIATRLHNYPRVARLFQEHPWLGLGPGNYVAANALEILDNQYLGTLVSLGVVGLFGFVVLMLFPAVTGLHAARTATEPTLRGFAGATCSGLFVAAVCSMTFDSLSFPVFALTLPVLIGLAGAAWIMVRQERDLGPGSVPASSEPPGAPLVVGG